MLLLDGELVSLPSPCPMIRAHARKSSSSSSSSSSRASCPPCLLYPYAGSNPTRWNSSPSTTASLVGRNAPNGLLSMVVLGPGFSEAGASSLSSLSKVLRASFSATMFLTTVCPRNLTLQVGQLRTWKKENYLVVYDRTSQCSLTSGLFLQSSQMTCPFEH